MRANNYWDNFRSFSRQNRFTSDNGPPIAAAPAAAAAVVINNGDNCDSRDAAAAVAAADAASRVIAQVTPRQLQTDPRSAGATGLLNRATLILGYKGHDLLGSLVKYFGQNRGQNLKITR